MLLGYLQQQLPWHQSQLQEAKLLSIWSLLDGQGLYLCGEVKDSSSIFSHRDIRINNSMVQCYPNQTLNELLIDPWRET